MARLQLKVSPTFKAKVILPLASGEDADITFTFRHRTRSEIVTHAKARQEATAALAEDDIEGHIDLDVLMILDLAEGWDLPDEFNEENIRYLIEHHCSAPGSIYEVYLKRLTAAKEGNSGR